MILNYIKVGKLGLCSSSPDMFVEIDLWFNLNLLKYKSRMKYLFWIISFLAIQGSDQRGSDQWSSDLRGYDQLDVASESWGPETNLRCTITPVCAKFSTFASAVNLTHSNKLWSQGDFDVLAKCSLSTTGRIHLWDDSSGAPPSKVSGSGVLDS